MSFDRGLLLLGVCGLDGLDAGDRRLAAVGGDNLRGVAGPVTSDGRFEAIEFVVYGYSSSKLLCVTDRSPTWPGAVLLITISHSWTA